MTGPPVIAEMFLTETENGLAESVPEDRQSTVKDILRSVLWDTDELKWLNSSLVRQSINMAFSEV